MTAPTRIVVMGASGCGKSTIGAALASRLGVPFCDADDLHPPTNVDKLSRRIPLTDADRAPWLAAVGETLAAHRTTGVVVACSALKLGYRDALREYADDVSFLHLDVPRHVLAAPMVVRTDHFMPLGLLDSQLDTLEPLADGERGCTIDAGQGIDVIVATAADFLRRAATRAPLGA